jgi:hypothetical protein
VATDAPLDTTPRSAPRRALDWFWRGNAFKQVARAASARSRTALELGQRARLLLELARRAEAPTEPLPLMAGAPAAELNRQAAYWAVRALADAGAGGASDGRALWSQLDSALLERVAGPAENAHEIVELVEAGSFIEPWQLAKEQQVLRARELGRVARVLLDELEWPARARDALWLQRLLRLGLLGVLAAVVLVLVGWRMNSAEAARDIAPGKAWRTSSSIGIGCTSPVQQCSESADFFFHTREESSAWVEIDLGKPTRFSGVRVDNRRDCCFERAVPLLLEVSNKQEGFRQIAQRTTSFTSWLAEFPPVEARYVRLRAPSRTNLHLAQVKVLR